MLRSFAALELASVTAFVELELQLARLGAPSSLRRRCRDAVRDERRHARLLLALAGERAPEDPSDPLHVEVPAIEIALHNATEGCVSECWSAVLAHYKSRRAASPALRRAYRRIARDETRHGQLAWDLDAWLTGHVLTGAERREVARRLRGALAALEGHAADLVRGMPPSLGLPTPDEADRAAARFVRQARGAVA
jgi:hypothetical protein